MDEAPLTPKIIDFEERDVLGMPTTPLFIALGEEPTIHSKVPRCFFDVVMPKLRLKRRKNRRKKASVTKADDEIEMGDGLLNASVDEEKEPDGKSEEEEAKKKAKFDVSRSNEDLENLEEMLKQWISLQDRLNSR